MYAYVETSGTQMKMAPGDKLKVDKLNAAPGSVVVFDKVLAVIKDGGNVFGAPHVAGVKVTAEVVGDSKTAKVIVFKQKPRKAHRKLRGHRQQLTTIMIKEIQGV